MINCLSAQFMQVKFSNVSDEKYSLLLNYRRIRFFFGFVIFAHVYA